MHVVNMNNGVLTCCREFAEAKQHCTVHITDCKNDFHEDERHIEEHIYEKVCALLNSGGGVLILENADHEKAKPKDLDIFLQRLEQKLKSIIDPSSYGDVFDRFGEFNYEKICLFVKAPEHVCTVNSHLFLASDTSVTQASYKQMQDIMKLYKKEDARVPTNDLTNLPTFDPNQFQCGRQVGFHEGKQIQFKYFKSSKELFCESKHQQGIGKCISAFANGDGGEIFIGINDNDSTVYGQSLSNQKEIEDKLCSLVQNMHWGFSPEKGIHWDAEVFPVQGSPSNSVVIVVKVAGMRNCGGVFYRQPESYYLQPSTESNTDEALCPLGFQEWKTKILPKEDLEKEFQGL